MRSPRTATKSSPRSPQLEKAHTQQGRPNAAKNKLINFKKIMRELIIILATWKNSIKGDLLKGSNLLIPDSPNPELRSNYDTVYVYS